MLYHLTAAYGGDAHLWGAPHFSSCFQFKPQPLKINVMGEYSDNLEVKKGVINCGEYHFRDWRRLRGWGSNHLSCKITKHDNLIDLKKVNGCGAVEFAVNRSFYIFELLFLIHIYQNEKYKEFHAGN